MSNVNDVRLIGNVGHDINVNMSQNGGKAGVFSIAVNDYYTDAKGETVNRTNWFRCCVYGKVLEAVENSVRQGDKVLIIGELRAREYVNKEGVKVQQVEITCSHVYILVKKS